MEKLQLTTINEEYDLLKGFGGFRIPGFTRPHIRTGRRGISNVSGYQHKRTTAPVRKRITASSYLSKFKDFLHF